MRKILPLAAVLALFLQPAVAQEKENSKKIEGSGNMITREINVGSFDELTASGVFSVELTQGGSEGVRIEAEDNLQEYFEVKQQGSKLHIQMKKGLNYSTKKKMKVHVSFLKLKSMEFSTVGNVSSGNNLSFDDVRISNKSVGSIDLDMTAKTVNVDNDGVGNVRLGGKADNAVIRNNGVGSIEAAQFVVQKMDIDNSGVGSAEVNAQQELKVKDSFLGKVTNKGAAPVRKKNKVVIR